MQLDIVTPERLLSSTPDVSSVIVPGIEGQFEVLPGHAPFLTIVGTGVLSYQAGGTKHDLMVSGGFCEVDRDRIAVMCEAAAKPSEVDRGSEEAAHLRLQQELAALGPVSSEDEGFQRKKAEVERAATKLLLK